jgi:uncharacterized protein (DUF2249 family)
MLADKMSDSFLTLDVRDDIRAGREPLGRILETVESLGEGQGLRLIAPFKPMPLFFVLGRMGYAHRERMLEPDMWEVLFEKGAAPAGAPATEPPDVPLPVGPGHGVEVDARGLEPPQPLVTILEALESLPAMAELLARTDRRPIHLYPQLEARGFTGTTEEQADGSFLTVIVRSAQ